MSKYILCKVYVEKGAARMEVKHILMNLQEHMHFMYQIYCRLPFNCRLVDIIMLLVSCKMKKNSQKLGFLNETLKNFIAKRNFEEMFFYG